MNHLTYEQRYTISILITQGKSKTEIAAIIGKHKSTISRELKRNCDKRSGDYRLDLAQKKCEDRHHTKRKHLKLNLELLNHIRSKLKKLYSPEQIHGRAKAMGLDMVSHETIYQFIWKDKQKGGDLYNHLRRYGKRYRKRGALKDHRGQIIDRIDISQRPVIVETKSRIGDLEIDTIVGTNHKGALITIVDRKTKATKIALIPSRDSEIVANKIQVMLKDWKFAKTMTSDNGKEFAQHKAIAKKCKIDFYFAEPYKSWQRGLNENTNGLIRQFIGKKLDFIYLTDKYIQFVEDNLNNRPRKTLGFYTPNEVLLQQLNNPNGKVAFMN
jgi:transposase, IS30 family